MTDPQVWTLIGVTSAVFFAMLRCNNRAITHAFTAEVSRLDAKVDGAEPRLESRIDGVDTKVDDRFDRLTDVMNARFADVDHRLSAVESDLKLVKAHLIGQRSA